MQVQTCIIEHAVSVDCGWGQYLYSWACGADQITGSILNLFLFGGGGGG